MERHLASRGHPQPPPKKQHQEPAKAVRTSHWYLTDPKLPERFDSPGTWNYKINKQHPLFTTTSNQYGSYYPSIHEMPLKFHGQSSRFTEHLSRAGPYRNFSLNTK
ncbi:uncharacterized protein BJ171DRAFT_422497 [Polychytrium aggregatum]|uniref:uncharacterized protein n=1 Tax=Polychytrium aggregatum TaxID=110093 RepID=UPI0022FF3A97|nr:uncharacterized protein BJ171DRAFT_422497 [Polychytrium aggregatum]KAI9206200.1 hypothetical protein BJ171DRAFT_422497 [Polychytrium aggregatum]